MKLLGYAASDAERSARLPLAVLLEVPMVHEAEATKLMEAARALRPRILADRQRIESGRRLPEDLARELARAGFFRIYLPEAYGGLDLTPMAATEIFEELARADASVAWCVWNGNTYWTTVRWSKEVAQTVFADPDAILANSTRPSGQAMVVEGGYRVSGRWSLVSGCQLSAWFILMCTVHESGKPRLLPSGEPEFRFMLCPAADCDIVDTWTVSGLRGTGSHDVVVQDRFVPAPYASFHTRKPDLRRRRRWCPRRDCSCSIPLSECVTTCSRGARPRSRPGCWGGWRAGTPSRARVRRLISSI